VIYAEALMGTMPWDYWREDGEPREATWTVLRTLHGVLRRAPEHPVTNHLMIHAVAKGQPTQGRDLLYAGNL
jgi:hypothetical protein